MNLYMCILLALCHDSAQQKFLAHLKCFEHYTVREIKAGSGREGGKGMEKSSGLKTVSPIKHHSR